LARSRSLQSPLRRLLRLLDEGTEHQAGVGVESTHTGTWAALESSGAAEDTDSPLTGHYAVMRLIFSGSTCLVVVPLAVAVACGGNQGAPGEVGTYDDGGTFTGVPGADGGGALAVEVSPSATTICPGQCVDLAVTASGGDAPYAIAWLGGLASDGGVAHACPTATTTYSAIATDSSGHGGELASAGAQASGSATISVTPDCDAGTSTVTQATEVCSRTWAGVAGSWDPYDESALHLGAVTSDSQGDVIVAYSLIQNQEGVGVVTKFDAQCNQVWTHVFQPTVPPGFIQANVVPLSVATDASSNVVVAGLFSGSIDFGNGPLMSANFGVGSQSFDYYAGSAFLFKLDAQGATSWSKAFTSVEQATAAYQVAIDPGGNVALAATGPSGLDFGGGPITTSTNGATYLVQFHPDGSFGYARPITNLAVPGVTTNGKGSLWVVGTEQEDSMVVDWGGGQTQAAPGGVVWGEFDPAGSYVGSAAQPALKDLMALDKLGVTSASAVVDTTGDVFVATEYYDLEFPDAGTSTGLSTRAITATTPSGALAWSDTTTFAGEGNGAPNWLALDPSSNLLVGGDFQGTIRWGSAQVTSAGNYDVVVRTYDPSGKPRSIARWGSSQDDRLSAMATDPNGLVVVFGSQGAPGDSMGTGLFIAKLKP
jgi:hypothetical protein